MNTIPDSEPAAGRVRAAWPRTELLRALRSRNYRLFFAGQSISLIGTWMQKITVAWLVYRLTGSAFWLGVTGFAGQIPTFCLAPFAGVLVDRWDRYRILLATQVLSLIQASLLAVLALSHWIVLWQVVALSAVLGMINAFDIPSRQSLVVDLVEDPEDLSNAIALNSTMVNGARMIGPTVAGLLIALVGEGMSFALNAASFVAVLAALSAMRIKHRPRPLDRKRMLHEMGDGLRYAFGHGPIRSVLLLLSIVSLVAMPYTQLLPIFAGEVFHGGPRMLGYLTGASGAGAIIASLLLASLRSSRHLGKFVIVALTLFGAGLVIFAYSPWLSLALLALVVVGFGMMLMITACNTALQMLTAENQRGRVMSLFTMAFMGMGPIGCLIAGSLATHWGAPTTLALGGILCLFAVVGFGRTTWGLQVQRP